MPRWVGAVACAFVVTIATSAAADQASCAKSAEQGQVARRDGKLREAHRHFVSCTTDCPRIIANDCASWAEQVLTATPTIVVDAKDEAGHDVGDATLMIDGELITRQLDGKAIPVDPGTHTLTLQRGTSPKVTETIIAKEGAKARSVQMKLLPAPPPTPTTLEQPGSSNSDGGGHTIFPWLLVGAGAIVMGIGVVFIATTPDLPAGCNADTESCIRRPEQTDAEFQEDQRQAGEAVGRPSVGLLIGAFGAAAVVGGLIWHYLEPTKPRNAMIAPWLLPGAGGVVARHQF